jgi:Pyruvate/2-oxoacid:ferredoxin oxidoreductase gamma subunit
MKENMSPDSKLRPRGPGGRSRAGIVVSDQPIDYPKTNSIDLLLAMSQDACDTYFTNLKPSGLLFVDSTFVKDVPVDDAISIPFTEIRPQGNRKYHGGKYRSAWRNFPMFEYRDR